MAWGIFYDQYDNKVGKSTPLLKSVGGGQVDGTFSTATSSGQAGSDTVSVPAISDM
jgi:hypothetical protein